MKINNFIRLVFSILIAQGAGIIGALFTTPSIDGWYEGIIKPALNPPNWIFGPVWTTLFFLMGIAAFLIWSSYARVTDGQDKKRIKIALSIFLGQLVLNIFWSIVFFGWHSPGGALVVIIFLWLAILATIIAFYRLSKTAGWLLIPYILWVSFASYLNYSIWFLN